MLLQGAWKATYCAGNWACRIGLSLQDSRVGLEALRNMVYSSVGVGQTTTTYYRALGSLEIRFEGKPKAPKP